MKTCAEVRALEEAIIADGVSPDHLMEQAGLKIAREIHRVFGTEKRAVACVGKGNNGGDALVAIRYLREWGWPVSICSPFASHEWSELSRLNHERMGWPEIHPQLADCPASPCQDVLLDGLLGIGGRPGINGPLGDLAQEMNSARLQGAVIVSLDLPSGMDADRGVAGENSIVADLTLTIGIPKKGLLTDSAADSVGRLSLMELTELKPDANKDQLTTASQVRSLLQPRPHSWHKGKAGRVAIVAGSQIYPGAARLATLGALRGGAGLVTLFVPEKVSPNLLPAIPAEAILRSYRSLEDIEPESFDVIAIGPGLAATPSHRFFHLLEKIQQPHVLDAEALNLIAPDPKPWLREKAILTPHPGEFARLFPESQDMTRAEAALEFINRYPATLLLKGTRTITAENGKPLAYNGTGGAGLATGGNGDVLTGLTAALVAQGLSNYDACRSSSWLAGRAADLLTLSGKQSEQSLLPSDIADSLGKIW